MESNYNGVVILCYDNGKIKEIYTYRNGMMALDWISYYENGNTNYRGEMLNGLEEANCAIWHENGILMEDGSYVKGKSDGLWNFFNQYSNQTIQGYFEVGMENLSILMKKAHYINGRNDQKESYLNASEIVNEILIISDSLILIS